MMNKIKNFLEDQKIKRRIMRDLSAPSDIQNQAHMTFMKEVHERFPFSAGAPKHSYHIARYAIMSIIALVILNTTAVIYADTKDVPVSHPLYFHKLIAEEVELYTAPQEKRVALQIKFAERRVHELKFESESEEKTPSAMTIVSTSTKSNTISTSTRKSNLAKEKVRVQLEANLEKHIRAAEMNLEIKSEQKDEVKIHTQHIKDNHEVCSHIINIEREIGFKHNIDKICSQD